MGWRGDSKPDISYAPVELRRNSEGKLPPETPCPELDALEKSLGSLAVAATAVLAGCGVYQIDARSTISQSQFEEESEVLESKLRMLLLHTSLSLRQKERLEAVKKTMANLWVISRASYRLTDVILYSQSPEERVWASTYLQPGVSAAMELGMRLAEAINKNDAVLARDCVSYMKRVDDTVARAYPSADSLQKRGPRQLARAALISLLVIRDSFGTIAALRVFANTTA
ncbi:MAG: hypothetical protein QM758_23735 [Armatimonas sp.]